MNCTFIGFPNTGKSSVINSLKRSKACNVGSTPGVTKFVSLVLAFTLYTRALFRSYDTIAS